MRGGRLDRRVRVELRSQVQDTTGQMVDSWALLFTRWMGKRDVRATERFTDQLMAEVDTVFTGRYVDCKAIRPDTHRLVYEGRVYEIHGRTELGRREALEFACRARGEASYGE